MKKSKSSSITIALSLAVFCSAFFYSISISAQTIDFSKMESLQPRNIGPAGMSGRITAIDVVRSSPELIYAGSASGGVWKSESGGIAWEPIFDSELPLSIGALAVSQKNPDVIWVGTGEGNPRNSLTGGYGVYKSIDAGNTWQLMGLEKTRNIHRVIIHPDDPNTVYIGAIGSPWGDHEERGVYKTTDGGETWEKVLYVDQMTGVGDMVMDPSNPNKLLVNMWQHRREPWFFTSGGPSSGLYLTLDGGKSWKKQTAEDNGLPKGDLGRMGLAFAENRPERVYAIIEAKNNAFYQSNDGGFTWKMVNNKSEIGNRPFYYFDIFVDPQNENRVYSIYSNVSVSEDGGKSFERLIPNGLIHVDNHALYVNPDNPKYMILGNDGGMAITRDMGTSWQFIENLPLSQYYHIAVDNELPYNVYGGMQDNGSWTGPAYAWVNGGLRNDYYHPMSGGDGFDVLPDADDSRFGFSMSQQGNVLRYDKYTGNSKYVKPMHPDPDVELRFNWNAAIAQDPFDNSTIYFGSQFVHKSPDKGSSWDIISPDLTTNDTTKQRQDESGGLTIDATGAENHTTILAIEPSPLEQGVIWVGTDDGNLQLTRDGGKSWNNVIKNIKGVPEGSWIPQIHASPYNNGEAIVVINNYRRFDFKPYVFMTKNYGKSWKSLVGDKGIFGYALSFVQDPVEPNLMFLGTEHGMYISIDGAETWTKFNNGYPNVSTMDMVIQERESDLVIGTFGRAIYVLDDIQPLRVLAQKGQENVLNTSVTAVPPKTAYKVDTRSGNGQRHPGSATFEGQNRRYGFAEIKFFSNQPEQKASSSRGSQSRGGRGGPQAKIEIFDMDGTLVRSFDSPVRDGLNIARWRFDENPVGSEDSSPQNQTGIARFLTGGAPAMPGTYRVKISVGDAADETTLTYKMDPRQDISMEALIASRELMREIGSLSQDVLTMSKKVSEDLKQVDKILEALKDKSGDQFTEIKERTKNVKSDLDELQSLIGSTERGFRGGDSDGPTPLLINIFTAMRSISGSNDMPGRTQEMLMNRVKNQKVEIEKKMESWYAENWNQYLSAVKVLNFNPVGTN